MTLPAGRDPNDPDAPLPRRDSGHGARVAVAVYDGDCRLCRGFATLLRRSVPATILDVVPCASPIQRKLAPTLDEDTCRSAFTLVLTDGTVLTGGDAAARVLAMAPKLERHRWMIERSPTTWLARIAYRIATLLRRRGPCNGCGSGRR